MSAAQPTWGPHVSPPCPSGVRLHLHRKVRKWASSGVFLSLECPVKVAQMVFPITLEPGLVLFGWAKCIASRSRALKCIVLRYSCVRQLHYSAKCIASRPLCHQCQAHCACVPLGQVHCVKVTCVVAMCQCMCEPHCCAKCVAPSPLRQVRCAKCTVPSALCQVHCSMCQVHCANALPSALRPKCLALVCTCLCQVHCAKCAKSTCIAPKGIVP